MNDLPEPVSTYLEGVALVEAPVAFLRVGPAGAVDAAGGALERFGLGATAGTPSLALAVGSLGGLVIPGLPGAMAARGGESVLRGSLFKVGYEIFFTPIQPQD